MKNPFEKREIKKPEPESNVVNFEQPVIIARDSLGNPIGTAQSSIEADAMRGDAAEDMRQAA
ncbi:MAG: hypothetical protein V4682_01380 [Patescibacteria group bacterium]